MFGSPPPRGSFFFLDKKEAKNQGLELMLAILVETYIAAAQAPDAESGKGVLPWFLLALKFLQKL
ncbi:hypothetical protein ACFSNA_14005 [Pedobacter mendelii]|uniref:hypothetical protein n=1 Tax=Pedobacter mendelii TaxID=1908240 RepID=UPI00363CEFC5